MLEYGFYHPLYRHLHYAVFDRRVTFNFRAFGLLWYGLSPY